MLSQTSPLRKRRPLWPTRPLEIVTAVGLLWCSQQKVGYPVQCPKCRLENPSNTRWCDCGYDFFTGKVDEVHKSGKVEVVQRGKTGIWKRLPMVFRDGHCLNIGNLPRDNGPKARRTSFASSRPDSLQ